MGADRRRTCTRARPLRILLLLAVLAAGVLPALGAEGILLQTDVYQSGKDGYHTFRIPAIETAADGTLLAFAEARKHNAADPGWKKQDIDLVLKRSTDGGKTWSAMQLIEDAGEMWSAANPATVVDRRNGRVWLLYLRSKPGCSTDTSRPGTDDMQTLARTSDDHGRSWSEPVDLTAVARDMKDPQWKASVVGPGGMIQDRRGRLLAPVWKTSPYGVLAIFSEDGGKSWQRGGLVSGSGDEDQLVELAGDRLLLDYRQSKGPHRFMAESRDGGRTWSAPRPGLPVTPVCCAIERYPATPGSDRILWTGPKGPGRSNLVMRISADEAKTFPVERLIYQGPAAYSDLSVLKDKSVGVLWERDNYKYITFTRLRPAFVTGE